ncbi:hypothetical protein SAMN05421876_1131 [Kaistella jeonii]|uniref:ER-bound oxygenase mpaB/mpaB'/Rubber oxygenase catalytic domain-containing protein n=2 Tax=Kaistella jeonii TaxID=266749 RepID=A0A0C1D2L6_9FLAO|nr:oxygenase MpaB family protein [Kaistella jeonii]KIA88025.1 hypothetical protein OA86_12545 [Kaistella jeonii]SFC30697.1 hypothetical protein SAMN05421876_1131 [Kaistella jeonii]VEI95566.1 Latex clearing protein precursor [Kaistella jeonii]
MKPKFQNSPHFINYWKKGNGKELLDWSNIKPDFETFQKFAPLYHQVDDLGDEVVKETYLKLPYNEASSLIKKYSESSISENEETSESLKKFFLQMQEIPYWFDENLANVGARFCMRTGANGLIILRDFTLMGGYDFAYLNKPLIFTGALKKGAVKRLKDTLEFWVHVTRENALKPNSEAYQLIVRTRLMHSYARLKIKEKTDWDFQNWGEPINSWDMIATYTGFSLVFMQGLKKLGIKISAEEETGLFHLWKYIGYLLGIPAEFLPENRQQAVEQFYWWTTIQDEGDEDSAHLAQALLQENLDNTIYKHPFQRKMLLRLHQSMNWHLLDGEINDRLQIPKPKKAFSIFPKIVRKGNLVSQKIYLRNFQQYQKLVEMGSLQQIKVLDDYIKHTPKDFHY